MNLFNCEAQFVLSAYDPKQFISDDVPKFVFAGRSNVGKSSVINTLTRRKSLARVGDTPGKTRCVNYFLLKDLAYYVDLPGYGYARVSHAEKQRWSHLLEAFFADTSTIRLGVLVVDARHTPTEQDRTMAGYFQMTCLPFLVIANKVDKLKNSQVEARLQDIRETLTLDESVPLVPFSAAKAKGRDDVLTHFTRVLES